MLITVVQGFYEALEKGSLTGNPICGCRFVLKDGGFHIVDSSELAFRFATIGAFRQAFQLAKGQVLEPVMTVEVVAPVEFQSTSLPIITYKFYIILIITRCCYWRSEYPPRDYY